VNRLATAVALAVVAAGALAACGTDANTTEATGHGDLSQVTLRVGDQTGETRSRLTAAGLLKGLPYRIQWSTFPAAVNLHEALRAGAIDVGAAADSPTVTAIVGGSRIEVVAAWKNGGVGNYLLVPKDSPIHKLADLRGKRISPSTKGSVAHYLTLGVLKKAGLKPSDVKLNFLNPPDANAAFTNGGIDAWATWGIFSARARGAGARVLISGKGINSGLNVLSATRTAYADPKKKRAIADFSDRVTKGFTWARDKPQDFDRWYAGFAKQPENIAAQVRPDQAAYRRVPLDGKLAAELQTTYKTWIAAGALPAGRNMADYVAPGG
jgi:sulfonate transport system substrate-binding protein